MKRIATLFASFLLFQTISKAQFVDGTSMPNWTLTDMNGTSWDLYTLLNQGKTVVLDMSATWCGPCWNYHHSYSLRDFYNQYGPNGTVSPGRAMVFMFEVDPNTTDACVTNSAGCNGTQGDWTAGTPYPILNPPNPLCDKAAGPYKIWGYPTVYMVCPDRKGYDLGQPGVSGLLSKMNASCPKTIINYDATTSALDPAVVCTNFFSPVVSLKNNGQTTLTSCKLTYKVDNGTLQDYNWTGFIATGQEKNVTLSSIAVPSTGSHTLTVTTSAPNGQTDQNTTNDSKTYNFTANLNAGLTLPVTESFETTTFPPTNWMLNNPDNKISWSRSNTVGGSGTTSSIVYDGWSYGDIGQSDELILPPINVSGNANPFLEFDVAYSVWALSNAEQLEVFVSTDCATSWTNLYNKSGDALATTAPQTDDFYPTASQWRKESINLSNYVGNNKLFVKFKATNNSGSKLYVDNINVKQNTTGVVNSVIDNTLVIFPNPASDYIQISYESEPTELLTISIYNKLGQKVNSYSKSNLGAGKQEIKIETSQLSSDIYLLQIVSDHCSVTRKIVIN
jgi:hypothetical protein